VDVVLNSYLQCKGARATLYGGSVGKADSISYHLGTLSAQSSDKWCIGD
jgi:hypothetical protein